MPRKYISLGATAERHDTSIRAVYDKIKNDPTFPRPYKLSGGCTRLDLAELEAWEAARRAGDAACAR